LSRSANTGSQAVPPTTVSDSQLKESTLSFTGSISEQDHHPQSTEEIDIYSSSTHSSEFSGKMTNLTTEETVTASSSPTKGDQSNDYSSYSTGATVYTDIAFTNAMTTSDESMTVAGSKSSTLAQSTLTQPESSSTGVGSHAISDGTQSPQSLTTDDTNRVNMTVTGRLDTSTLSAAATAMSLSDEKRTTAKTSMPLTSSVRTTGKNMNYDQQQKLEITLLPVCHH
jgi:hypothetical protein